MDAQVVVVSSGGVVDELFIQMEKLALPLVAPVPTLLKAILVIDVPAAMPAADISAAVNRMFARAKSVVVVLLNRYMGPYKVLAGTTFPVPI